MIGVAPSISGESWFGVEQTQSFPSFTQSHAQPLPKRVAAAFAKASLNASIPPSSLLMASLSCPIGAPPPFGEMPFQKRLWLACPPPWLRTAPRMFSGTLSRSEINSSTDLDSRSVPAMAALTLVT